jgi:hypothetical protein
MAAAPPSAAPPAPASGADRLTEQLQEGLGPAFPRVLLPLIAAYTMDWVYVLHDEYSSGVELEKVDMYLCSLSRLEFENPLPFGPMFVHGPFLHGAASCFLPLIICLLLVHEADCNALWPTVFAHVSQRLDLRTGVWSPTPTQMQTARIKFSACMVMNDASSECGPYALVTGGCGENGMISSAERYEFETGEWRTQGTVSAPHPALHVLLSVGSDVFVIGGENEHGLALQECFMIDAQHKRECVALPPLPEPRRRAAGKSSVFASVCLDMSFANSL